MRTHQRIGPAIAAGLAMISTLVAAPALAVEATPSGSPVVINEIESSGGDPDDWIELKNISDSPVDVSGWIVMDSDPRDYAIPANTTIEAGDYLVLEAADFGYGLGGTDAVRIFEADGTTLVDEHAWTGHAATTYGRCADGTGEFVTTAEPTKGAANACEAPLVGNLVINEVESSGGDPDDWIELYNRGTNPVDLSGVVVMDSDPRDYAIADGTTLAAGEFLVLEAADFGYGLGGGDSVRIFEADGTTLIDQYTWESHAATTYGRCPDGFGEFVTTVTPTKGAPNECESVDHGVVINEIESNGGDPGDWVELKNISDEPVDITGWGLKDDNDNRDYVFEADTIIEPGDYYVADEADFDFGLGDNDSVRLYLADGVTLVDAHTWNGHAATTLGRCPDGTGEFIVQTSSTKGAENDCSVPVRINEVESSDGDPADWIELVNIGTEPVDLSGFGLKDDNDGRDWTFEAGTMIAPGEYLVVDEAEFGFGLGGSDSARLFDANGDLVDETSWEGHAAVTWGRCPDGTGDFANTSVSTKGAENLCEGDLPAMAWPGGSTSHTVDPANVLGGDISGLAFTELDGVPTLWAVDNGNGRLFQLTELGGQWVPALGWEQGATLRYPDGTGTVDAEGVGFTTAGVDGGVYIASERNDDFGSVSRPSVLRYDVPAFGGTMTATHEWNLAEDLPHVGNNSGLEGIAWIPDSQLVAEGLVDESTGQAYNPARYPGHGGGLFFVAVEADGMVHGYALMDNGDFQLVTSFASGFPGAMELEFDPTTGDLWVMCDQVCNGRSTIHRITDGAFSAVALYDRPADTANLANEGFAIAPNSQCIEGTRPVVWGDDSNTDGHALRQGTLHCVPGEDGGPDLPGEPDPEVPVDDDQLNSDSQGGFTAPEQAPAGGSITIQFTDLWIGEEVRVWLHSTPRFLGQHTVAANGTVTVTIPADVPAGAHRLVVTDAAGNLIGWQPIEITSAAGGSSAGGTNAGGSATLPQTGSMASASLLAAALAAMLAGAVMVNRTRRRV